MEKARLRNKTLLTNYSFTTRRFGPGHLGGNLQSTPIGYAKWKTSTWQIPWGDFKKYISEKQNGKLLPYAWGEKNASA